MHRCARPRHRAQRWRWKSRPQCCTWRPPSKTSTRTMRNCRRAPSSSLPASIGLAMRASWSCSKTGWRTCTAASTIAAPWAPWSMNCAAIWASWRSRSTSISVVRARRICCALCRRNCSRCVACSRCWDWTRLRTPCCACAPMSTVCWTRRTCRPPVQARRTASVPTWPKRPKFPTRPCGRSIRSATTWARSAFWLICWLTSRHLPNACLCSTRRLESSSP